MDDIKNIIESLLFVSKEPLTIERMKRVLDIEDTKTLRNALDMLSDEYEERKGAFFMREAGGGYQIITRPEYKEWIKRLIQPSPVRLSRASMETLTIVAYKQPVIRSDVERIRGVDSGGILRMLMERRLIKVLGRKEIAGRPLIYATTRQFLEVFGLKDLKELPSLKEIENTGNSTTLQMIQQTLPVIQEKEEVQYLPVQDEEDGVQSCTPE